MENSLEHYDIASYIQRFLLEYLLAGAKHHYDTISGMYHYTHSLFQDAYHRLNGPCMNGECTEEDMRDSMMELGNRYQEVNHSSRHHPQVGYKDIAEGSDRRNPIIISEDITKQRESKTEAAKKLLWWCFLFTVAFPWLAAKTYMGMFESTWWFYKNNVDLFPEHMIHGTALYMNRENGVIIGFYNTSHNVTLTNWTMFPDYDPDKEIEEEEEETSSKANPVLLFNLPED